MKKHYLDNSATTQVLKEAAERAAFYMTEEFGNPSSLHSMGFTAAGVLEESRETVAKSLGADKKEIFFTSGGTGGNHIAIMGAAHANKKQGRKIVTTAIEHPAVLEHFKYLETQGYEVAYIKPKKDGNIDLSSLEVIDRDTVFVSMMLVNNETGAVLPVDKAAQRIKEVQSPALLHVDAVQAYMKMKIPLKDIDLLTVSGHKIHGPKGVGAMYISRRANIRKTLFGGGQEGGYRPGTESVPLIAAFETAVRETGNLNDNMNHVRALNNLLREGLKSIGETKVNSPDDASPYILNFSPGSVMAQTMLNFLSSKGIYVSSGSACGKLKPSHVLEAMEVEKEYINSAIRVSFSRFSTKEDVAAFIEAYKEGLNVLAKPR